MRSTAVRAWLIENWFLAGLTAALFLFALVPLLLHAWPAYLLLVFLQLPIYMIHQVEEHLHDRFRLAINQELAGGREALTHDAVLVVNLAGVWLVDLAALYLARFVRPGLGLIAFYLALVNAFVHIVAALLRREYNPGLLTAVVLFLPTASAGAWFFIQHALASPADHVCSLAIALLLHLVIILHLLRRTRQLSST